MDGFSSLLEVIRGEYYSVFFCLQNFQLFLETLNPLISSNGYRTLYSYASREEYTSCGINEYLHDNQAPKSNTLRALLLLRR